METSDRSLSYEVLSFLRAKTDQAWVVGGYVRDQLLGRSTADIDVVVPSPGTRLARAVADRFGGAFFALDSSRDIGRALLSSGNQEIMVDISRIQGKDLAEDLSQRDFTINAMALDLMTDPPHLIDLHGGHLDLNSGVIRAVKESSFEEDPVRLLRALRFEVELDFAIEKQTESWMHRDAALIASASAERVQHELVLIFRHAGAARRLRSMDNCQLLEAMLPELQALKGVAQSAPHYLDVFEHTLETVSYLEDVLQAIIPSKSPSFGSGSQPSWLDFPMETVSVRFAPLADQIRSHMSTRTSADRTRQDLLKWAAMLHDVGKPATQSTDEDGRIRFLGHERHGAQMAETTMHRLRFSGSEVELIGSILQHHLRPSQLAREPLLPPRAAYRFFRDTGAAGVDICLLSLADHLATWADSLVPGRWERRVATVEMLLTAFFRHREIVVAPTPLITGDDLIEKLGMKQGPVIGIVLEQVRESQASGEVNTREDALLIAQRVLAELSGG